MKRGHVTGHKKEQKGSTDWYKEIESSPHPPHRSGMGRQAGKQ